VKRVASLIAGACAKTSLRKRAGQPQPKANSRAPKSVEKNAPRKAPLSEKAHFRKGRTPKHLSIETGPAHARNRAAHALMQTVRARHPARYSAPNLPTNRNASPNFWPAQGSLRAARLNG